MSKKAWKFFSKRGGEIHESFLMASEQTIIRILDNYNVGRDNPVDQAYAYRTGIMGMRGRSKLARQIKSQLSSGSGVNPMLYEMYQMELRVARNKYGIPVFQKSYTTSDIAGNYRWEGNRGTAVGDPNFVARGFSAAMNHIRHSETVLDRPLFFHRPTLGGPIEVIAAPLASRAAIRSQAPTEAEIARYQAELVVLETLGKKPSLLAA